MAIQKHPRRRNPRIIFRLKELRKAQGYNLETFAAKSGVPRSTLGDLESGRNAMPSDDNLLAICDALKIKPGQLIDTLPDSP